MRIAILNESKQGLGGGFSFVDNFKAGFEIVTPEQADILLIPSASMVQRDTVQQWVGKKKIVLRVDNYLKNSRNRNTGMSRMKDFAEWSDCVIYQSEWARGFLEPFLKNKKSYVVLNGSRKDIFNPDGAKYPKDIPTRTRYLYVRLNSDMSKGWHMAHQKIQELHQKEDCEFWIVGVMEHVIMEYNFDFFNGERHNYFGVVNDLQEMAKIIRSCDKFLYAYFCDACSNSLNEAMLSKLQIVDCYGMAQTGGAPEQLISGARTIEDMVLDYKKIFEGIL